MADLLVICLCLMTMARADVTTTFQGMMFLYRYGYISEKDMSHVSTMEDDYTKKIMREALQEFQERSGLQITGEMDDETLKEMSLPRCGVKDVILLGKEDQPVEHLRSKRYVLGRTRWEYPRLTYRYIRLQSGNQGRYELQREMDRAFQTWTSVSSLQFRNVTSPRAAVNLNVLFARGDHGDNSNFDGPSYINGPVLAHAFYPNPGIGGDIHFDDEENWVVNNSNGVDFYSVALHELGHSIGLDHSTVRDAIMFPTYRNFRPGVGLHPDDIAGVRQLYGLTPRRRGPSRRRPPGSATAGAPPLCGISRIDALFRMPNTQDIYIFSELECYLLQDGMVGTTAPGYPRPISEEFPGVQVTTRVDAAFTWPNGQIFILERDQVWVSGIDGQQFASPQQIDNVFRGIPNDVSAACFWPGDLRTYFFKGDQYWRYDNTTVNAVKSYFPHNIRRWAGVSGPVDAVLCLDYFTYFFQDDLHYKYSNRALRVFPDYPRRTRESLFGCTSVTADSNDDEDFSNIIMTAELSSETKAPSAVGNTSSGLLKLVILSFTVSVLNSVL